MRLPEIARTGYVCGSNGARREGRGVKPQEEFRRRRPTYLNRKMSK